MNDNSLFKSFLYFRIRIQNLVYSFQEHSQTSQNAAPLMKHLVFVYVLFLTPFLFAEPTQGQKTEGVESELNYSPLVKVETEELALKGDDLQQEAARTKTPALENTIGSCTASKIKYIQSASRKLYRAISGKGYKIKKIKMTDLRIGGTVYQSFPQKEGKVLGLMSKKSASAFVLINTKRGHLVAKLNWKNCRPVSSSILSPKVSISEVDMKPFKYWGLRVLWTLPKKLGKEKNIKKILIASMK